MSSAHIKITGDLLGIFTPGCWSTDLNLNFLIYDIWFVFKMYMYMTWYNINHTFHLGFKNGHDYGFIRPDIMN